MPQHSMKSSVKNTKVDFSKPLLLVFYMDGCGHCIDFEENIWSKLKIENVICLESKDDAQSLLGQLYGTNPAILPIANKKTEITGFPTIVRYKNGEFTEFSGEINPANIESWFLGGVGGKRRRKTRKTNRRKINRTKINRTKTKTNRRKTNRS